MTTDPYFDGPTVNRQLLLWTIATRRQLERWEPLVAANVATGFGGRSLTEAEIWQAAVEHHFTLIAARNLIRALDLAATGLTVEATMRAELIEGRDLHEHWDANLPVFSTTPRVTQPTHRSGKNFAARNPNRGPYWWLGWRNKSGAMLLPHVSAPALRHLLDGVEAYVLARDPLLGAFLSEPLPSPWITSNGEWWPKVE
jgi:hypothetical protein